MVEIGERYVVTVLKGMAPIGMVNISCESASTAETEVLHPDIQSLPEIIAALEMAFHAVAFLHWKLNGVLPRPLGMNDEETQHELPF